MGGDAAVKAGGTHGFVASLTSFVGRGNEGAEVAALLGVQQAPGLSLTESLVGALSRRQLLLVLDNCEHALAAVAQLCGILLPAADDIRVLATSREPIGVPGEVRFRLRPLPAPEPGVPPERGVPVAVRLFADRARQADPRF